MKRVLLILSFLLIASKAFAVNITNEADLQAMYLDATLDYTVTANITVTGDFESYMVNNYSGTFDGGSGSSYVIDAFQFVVDIDDRAMFKGTMSGTVQNVTMTNVVCVQTNDGAAVIAVSCSGTINNVVLSSGSITVTRHTIASIAEAILTGGTISNCVNSITVTHGSGFVGAGGICSLANSDGGVITNCTNNGNVTQAGAGNQAGGILGRAPNSVTITNCTNNGDVTSGNGDYAGGIVGNVTVGKTCTMSGCVNTGAVRALGGDVAGGIAGLFYGTMDNCSNSGSVTADRSQAGGIISQNGSTSITNCTNTGDVSTPSGFTVAGGIIGNQIVASGAITNCTSSGTLSSLQSIGGIVGVIGVANTTITSCSFTGTTNNNGSVSTGAMNGGIVGNLNVNSGGTVISKCWNTGTIGGTGVYYYYGGIVGYMVASSTISDCYSTGNVGHSNQRGHIGGLIGRMDAGVIKKCYSTGNVTMSVSYGTIGGFIGSAYGGTIDDSYSTGTVTGGNANKGMFNGYNNGGVTITNCGCLDDATIRDIGNPAGDVTYAKADTTEWYDKTEDVYDAGANVWDFTPPAVWYEWSTDYPKFTAEPSGDAIFFGCHL